jgi:hypothetical protein
LYLLVVTRKLARRGAACELLFATPMLPTRPVWMRGLRLYQTLPRGRRDLLGPLDRGDDLLDPRIHARSRFQSVSEPGRYALYTVHDTEAWAPGEDRVPGEHTLSVVREFRRVPLHASALGLLLLTARAGSAAPVVAALAHFVERAVSLYQPAYLLLAHSLESPRLSILMLGVHECAALQEAGATAFSVDRLLPELEPWLAVPPEWFSYCPEPEAQTVSTPVSPYAV